MIGQEYGEIEDPFSSTNHVEHETRMRKFNKKVNPQHEKILVHGLKVFFSRFDANFYGMKSVVVKCSYATDSALV